MNTKRILLIEDDGAMAKSIQEAITSKGSYLIDKAYSYLSAKGKWKEANEKKIEYSHIVVDLNIGVVGMDNELIKKYYPFIGMAFLDEIRMGKSDDEKRSIESKIIIYTGYKSQLENVLQEKGWDIGNMQIISKTPNSINELKNRI